MVSGASYRAWREIKQKEEHYEKEIEIFVCCGSIHMGSFKFCGRAGSGSRDDYTEGGDRMAKTSHRQPGVLHFH
jgi:hypothetical protein